MGLDELELGQNLLNRDELKKIEIGSQMDLFTYLYVYAAEKSKVILSLKQKSNMDFSY